MGRVCYHTCEGACNRGKLDEAVGINSVERFLGDEAIKQGWKFAVPASPESGKNVLVVGAGPSGMSAAYHLRKLGHAVTVHEAGPCPAA
jgi:NADPH-dependent glutamate synthase beta subunit-like oxidoreductase